MRWKLPLLCASLLAAACASDGATIEPEHLSLRDLLGVSPEQAMQWGDQERAQARKILASNEASPGEEHLTVLGWGQSEQEWILAGVAAFDGEREYRREAPIAFATAKVEGERLRLRAHPAPEPGQTPATDTENEFEQVQLYLEGWQEEGESSGWAELPQHAQPYLQSLVRMAGPPGSTSIVIRPAVQEPFAALYLPPGGTATRRQEPAVLLVNPVLLAAIDPTSAPAGEFLQRREIDRERSASARASARNNFSRGTMYGATPVASGGNPYSFFGSVSECAAAERLRCEGCLPAGSCEPTSRDAESGNAECEALSANDGRGYFLYCANISLAIGTVAECAGEDVPQCPAVTSASNQLLLLDSNSQFVDDDVCRQGLDGCLAELYGDPDDDFPEAPIDGGVGPGPTPPAPRQTDVSCGEQNCDFSPQCSSSCGGASCGDSFNCGDCGSDGDSGGGSGGGGCGGGDDGGGDGCSGGGCSGGDCGGGGCGGCDSDSGDSDSGGGCGGSDDSGGGGSCSGGDSGGDSCGGGGGSCGGDSCGGDSCGGSSCSNCSTAGQQVRAQWSLAMTVLWALLPLFFLSGWLRKEQAEEAVVGNEESP